MVDSRWLGTNGLEINPKLSNTTSVARLVATGLGNFLQDTNSRKLGMLFENTYDLFLERIDQPLAFGWRLRCRRLL
jgi:hypothetical protein